MPKKKSSKGGVGIAEEASAVEPSKPSSTPKKLSSEIDDIFAGKKRKKPEKKNKDKENEKLTCVKKTKKKKKKKKKKATEENEEGRFSDPAARSRKKTEDGFTIYTEEELGINSNAGNTVLCPFDCQCCL